MRLRVLNVLLNTSVKAKALAGKIHRGLQKHPGCVKECCTSYKYLVRVFALETLTALSRTCVVLDRGRLHASSTMPTSVRAM